MSLTSYRAAPPRDKPLRAFEKPKRNESGQRPRAPIDRSGGFLRRQPGQSPWVRGVCTNARLLWKGLQAIFSGFYGGRNGDYRAELADSCALARKSVRGQRCAAKRREPAAEEHRQNNPADTPE